MGPLLIVFDEPAARELLVREARVEGAIGAALQVQRENRQNRQRCPAEEK